MMLSGECDSVQLTISTKKSMLVFDLTQRCGNAEKTVRGDAALFVASRELDLSLNEATIVARAA